MLLPELSERIDDLGRQQCSPRDLLNWWMVPLESRVQYMTLTSGEKLNTYDTLLCDKLVFTKDAFAQVEARLAKKG